MVWAPDGLVVTTDTIYHVIACIEAAPYTAGVFGFLGERSDVSFGPSCSPEESAADPFRRCLGKFCDEF